MKEQKVPCVELTLAQLLAWTPGPNIPLPFLNVDLLGAFYTQISQFPLSAKSILESLNSSGRLTIWIDGQPTNEKEDTHLQRAKSKRASLAKCSERIDEIIRNQLTPRKADYRKIKTGWNSTASLPDFSDLLPIGNWCTWIYAPGEADVAMYGIPEGQNHVAISGDSDHLFSTGSRWVAIPIKRGKAFIVTILVC